MSEWKYLNIGRWRLSTLIREPLSLSNGELSTYASRGGEVVDGKETPYRSHDLWSVWWTRGKWATNKLEVNLRISNGHGDKAGITASVTVPLLVQFSVKLCASRRLVTSWVLDGREFGVTLGGHEGIEFRAAWERDSCGQRTYLLEKEQRGEGRSYAGRFALWQGVRVGISSGRMAALLFGKSSCVVETVESGEATVPMPEGNYDATWKRERRIWRRARVPFALKTRESVSLDIPGGIPVPGKGENSWDCGDDAICGTGGTGVSEAVANAVSAATRARLRHGGKGWVPANGWPSPPAEVGSDA